MSWCEDYDDPFDRTQVIERDDEDEEFDCCYPDKCVMAALHFRSECHTAEDVEAHFAEMKKES